ncbi:transcriptional regulator NrdR [Alkalispirochaeta sphaeroplastigenens]|uniref:Transcriptional repressor NrdR n=1 Tax=Alkalispirochaeta sphaeroplastigenens TaxID=1187066 RepID=A0A2S4JGX2_9SPIO|nr:MULTISPECIES: transcriptional regulator NrdR [Alkalispirochaeta]POQ98725.1 transcriptional regulator NrdR [Alkalispirochaeta sphaeroplastigenens]
MRCPKCTSLEDRVIESRALADGGTIRRRRQCDCCGYRFTSYERIEEKPLMVVKKSEARREPFDRAKLEKGIQQALRKRPVSQNAILSMIDELEEEATREGMDSHEIAASRLGEMVLNRLYTIDRVAYVRFASVYRNFESVHEFIREIEQLEQG